MDLDKGDLVICISNENCDERVAPGRHYRVETVIVGRQGTTNGEAGVTLYGVDHLPMRGFCAARFRKLNDTADDAGLIERIKRCRPAIVEREKVAQEQSK